MSRMIYFAPIVALVLSACVVVPGRHGQGVVLAPALPMVVELGVDPFYFYRGYYYHYTNDRWSYSHSRNGAWSDLPRDRYPREIHYRDHSEYYDRDHDRYR